MKNKDVIYALLSAILLFLFISYFTFESVKMTKFNLIREDLANDSIIFLKQDSLHKMDSVLLKKDTDLKNIIIKQEKKIKSLQKQNAILLDTLRK